VARLTSEQRELILADFHTGVYTLRELGFRYNTSHVTIGKIVKGLEPKHEDKVNTISTMTAELHQENYQEVNAVNKAIENKTKHILLFENSALENQRKANLAIKALKDDKIDENCLYPLEVHSRITQRNKETVLGKDKTIETTNINAQSTKIEKRVTIIKRSDNGR